MKIFNLLITLSTLAAAKNLEIDISSRPSLDLQPLSPTGNLIDCSSDSRYNLTRLVNNCTSSSAAFVLLKYVTEPIDLEYSLYRLLSARPDIVDAALQKTPDFEYRDAHGNYAIHRAILSRHTSIIDYLLIDHSNINLRNRRGWTPLMAALRAYDVSTTQKLLDLGADVNVCSFRGTPLFMQFEGLAQAANLTNPNSTDQYSRAFYTYMNRKPRIPGSRLRHLNSELRSFVEQFAQENSMTFDWICAYGTLQNATVE